METQLCERCDQRATIHDVLVHASHVATHHYCEAHAPAACRAPLTISPDSAAEARAELDGHMRHLTDAEKRQLAAELRLARRMR